MGENQLSALPELLMTSPMPRTSAASANDAIAAPVAVRACRHSCAVTAATAPNTMATPVMPRHIAAVSTTREAGRGHRQRHRHRENGVHPADEDQRGIRAGIPADHR